MRSSGGASPAPGFLPNPSIRIADLLGSQLLRRLEQRQQLQPASLLVDADRRSIELPCQAEQQDPPIVLLIDLPAIDQLLQALIVRQTDLRVRRHDVPGLDTKPG